MARPRRGGSDLEAWITQAEELLRELAAKNDDIQETLVPTAAGVADEDPMGGWGAWEIPTVACPSAPGAEDLLYDSNWHALEELVENLGEEAQMYRVFRGRRYILFWTWYAAEKGEDEQPSHAADTIYETETALEDYPLLDEDDHSRREMEATNENFRNEGSRLLREAHPGEKVDENNEPEGWLGRVMSWFSEHPDSNVSRDLDARDGDGGYPDERNMRQALHELDLLDPDIEKEYFSDEWDDYEFTSGNTKVKIAMQLGEYRDKMVWNGNAWGVVEIGKHRWSFAPVRFARIQEGRGDDVKAAEVAGAVLNTILRQDKEPAMADAVRENIDADFPTEDDFVTRLAIVIRLKDDSRTYTLKEYGGTVISWADFTWTETNPRRNEIAGRKRRS